MVLYELMTIKYVCLPDLTQERSSNRILMADEPRATTNFPEDTFKSLSRSFKCRNGIKV